MSKTVSLDIQPPITAAARRMTHLIESGYLPDDFKRDIRTLMEGALCWEIYSTQNAEPSVSRPHRESGL